MGLDMYLYAEKYFHTVYEQDKEKINQLVDIATLNELTKHRNHYSATVKVEVGYWRKANSIHNYFVQKHANGVDECQDIQVSREGLEKLKDICGQLSVSKDAKLAEELLPPKSGFFFGSTEIDEYYFNDMDYTYELLDRVLKETPDDCDFVYSASW
jgi:hypothetical protein